MTGMSMRCQSESQALSIAPTSHSLHPTPSSAPPHPLTHAWQPHPGRQRGASAHTWSLPGDRFVTVRATDRMARTRTRAYIDDSTDEIRVFRVPPRPEGHLRYTFTLSRRVMILIWYLCVAHHIAWRLGEIPKVCGARGRSAQTTCEHALADLGPSGTGSRA